VGVGAAGHFNQLFHNMPGRGAVGVAHGHIDDVFPAPSGRHFEFARNIENVGRQALYARKFRHDGPSAMTMKKRRLMNAMQQTAIRPGQWASANNRVV
jgi:hypothetical protein